MKPNTKKVKLLNKIAFRLVNSKFPPMTLFDDVVSQEDFATVYTIQALTNPRILNELGNLSLLSSNEIPFGIDGVNYVTAPFTHINPEGSRFSNGDFGVLYLADTIDTAIKETLYHQDKYFQNLQGLHYDTVDMRCLKVTFSASIVDLFQVKGIYEPEDYSLARRLGAELKKNAQQGFQYHSVRNQGATCWGLFSPIHVTSAIQTKHFEFIFDGKSMSKVRELVNQ
ncbi:RES family NAD+ phosphorylase [Colwellia sp. MB02u-6]|uniref:RES family NAD+ phosphorylase n=1 Tax=Colwellia sp. MB02u-6 TaxID=2759824 RepID=UPI0015F3C710|nr:RES family NAD+ phosphorylase [Colwellia sp. MB02u-6]MBA6327634.1 RES family NAD+ phosphorylase [Colwellia sp. MB02u-6]